jgi:hypothetical protein
LGEFDRGRRGLAHEFLDIRRSQRASVMDALNAIGVAAECAWAECAVLSEQTGLRGCIFGNESWAENGHPAATESGM